MNKTGGERQMRKKVWITISLVLVLPAMLVMSCAKESVQSRTENTPAAAPAAVTGPAAGTGRPLQEGAQTAAQNAAAEFSSRNVHFDFASAKLSPQARQLLNAKAEYLLANPGVGFTVEGHCDERGTSAYNMALGERRAEMVRQYLSYQGISASRMNTVSYGEERPLATGQNEAAWEQNRRAQFVPN
jgi:peptidoglycan-associated lipoprotein